MFDTDLLNYENFILQICQFNLSNYKLNLILYKNFE